jgi:pimeloyl-ACP methyl ester carboxylesterase
VKIGTTDSGAPIAINTLKVGTGEPLVLVHGFGGGIGSFNARQSPLSWAAKLTLLASSLAIRYMVAELG